MTNETGSGEKSSQAKHQRAWLNGYTVFAGAIMFVLGLWQVLAGITAVARDSLFATPPGYIYAFDIAVWGWILILLGVLMAGVAIVVLRGRNGGDTARSGWRVSAWSPTSWSSRTTRSGHSRSSG